MKSLKIIKNGIWNENPTLRLVLGMCPTIAVTTSAANGVGMGLAAMFVLVCSNIVISALRNFIPDQVRIPCYIVVIAAFVTIVELLLEAFVPELYASLGIFIPLIVVNCIILARAEAYANKHTIGESAADGIGMGIGFTLALIVVSSIREILGNGSIFGIMLFGSAFRPALIFALAPGGFLVLGMVMGLVNYIDCRKERKQLAIKQGRDSNG
ncbi:electron transport complex subunit E [Eubacteriales bacterium OttesenSCG-928-N14]|nr:electron transport complex subunit E [Eubacteriales bacterium OttesenSCG-928-N14]